MNILKNLLFSFRGKIGRADYIYGVIYTALLGLVSVEAFLNPARITLVGGGYDMALITQYVMSVFGLILFLWSFLAVIIKRFRELEYHISLSFLCLLFPPLLLLGLTADKSQYRYHSKLAVIDHTFFYALIFIIIISIFGLYRLTLGVRFAIFFMTTISILLLVLFWSDKHIGYNGGTQGRYKGMDSWIDLGFVLLIVFFVRSYILSPFQIIGPSMEDTFHGGVISYDGEKQVYSDGEFILVDKMTYRFSEPLRGDVVVFTPGIGPEKRYLIKRIIGLPGDTVKIENGFVFLAPANHPEIFTKLDERSYLYEKFGKTCISSSIPCDNESHTFIVPAGRYFLMGDNRPQSLDARKCFNNTGCVGEYTHAQFVPTSQIQGRVAYSLGHFDLLARFFIHDKIGSLSYILPYPKLGTLKQVIPFRGKAIQNSHFYTELN